jgi:phosphoglycerate dehydrogenase-like enzyme
VRIDRPKVLVNFHLGSDVRLSVPADTLAALRARFPGVEFTPADDAETLAREAADCEVFYGFRFPPELLARAPRLRWIQSASAGVEDMARALRGGDVVLTNAAGVAAAPIAEHALGVILMFCRNFHVAVRRQSEARWDRFGVMSGTGTPIRELRGSRLLIVGLGPIGLALANGSAALGATVRGVRRHPSGSPVPPFERVVGPPALDSLLPWADFVVLAVPDTPETQRMIGARQLELMRADAYLVNVARGSVVDEDALVAALQRGAIAGAGLDVFQEEPLPSPHPLWSLPNVVLTPHVSGVTPQYFERTLALFVENLARYLEGKPLRNTVRQELGYPSTGHDIK